MDTMRLLLGATVTLLVAAFVWAVQIMNQGVANPPAAELAHIQKQQKEVQKELDNLSMQRQQQVEQAKQVATSQSAVELEAIKAQLEASKSTLAAMEQEQKELKQKDSKMARDEEGLMGQRQLEKNDKELRRARMISDALLMGRVREYVSNDKVGTFVTVDVLMPEQVQVGCILAIRRKTGILGQMKVSEVTPEGAIANMLPGLSDVPPKAGDELIFPPQY
jgi:multidrug efflux pump subunit AcrA (membrane-fusion protein)